MRTTRLGLLILISVVRARVPAQDAQQSVLVEMGCGGPATISLRGNIAKFQTTTTRLNSP